MKTFYELQEGLQDPNIFKAFFLAGGPGSGKSYVAMRSTGGSGLKTINSDDAFEHLLKKAGMSLKIPPPSAGGKKDFDPEKDKEYKRYMGVRGRAKEITAAKKGNYLEGRIGLVIDGTGREADKILKQKAGLEELGYDTYMIFVNTSLDTALQRNADRPRSVPEPIVVKSWKDVQANIGKFSNMFRGGFIVVDNNDAGEDVFKEVSKRVRGLLRKKVTNTRARNWVSMEMKRRGITKAPKGF